MVGQFPKTHLYNGLFEQANYIHSLASVPIICVVLVNQN